MTEYTLPHKLAGERQRLALMSSLLDPVEQVYINKLGVAPGWRCTVTEPDFMRRFWRGWLEWSKQANIDYFIGRKIAAWLDSLGLQGVAGEGHTACFNGGSDWAMYWTSTMKELAPALVKSTHANDTMLEEFRRHFTNPHYGTSVITFTANWGRKLA